MKVSLRQVLVTGFEPFDGELTNPSGEIAQRLHGTRIAGRQVTGIVLPCVFGVSIRQLQHAIRTTNPVLVICLGLAAGRTQITPERVAINVDDARLPDNAGHQPIDVPVVKNGPAAYWSTLPIKAIVAELTAEKIPAAVSQSAGTYVCNHVFYGLMHALRRHRAVRGGFIHVPGPSAKSGLTIERLTAAIQLAAKVAVKTQHDRRETGGQTD